MPANAMKLRPTLMVGTRDAACVDGDGVDKTTGTGNRSDVAHADLKTWG